ncbi:MAG: hypothetical protein GX594_17105 [Pirellulaceae bacterium]|nr:hypothetical protein [Pirellulaceae bacterium]
MTTDLQTRWRVSIHESGHLAVGLLLAADPSERAAAIIESRAGDGCAPIPKSLGHFDRMIAVASGPAADEMLEREPVPPLPVTRGRPVNVSSLPVFPDEPREGGEGTAKEKSDPDEVRIAEWCIEGCARRPWEWLRNHENITTEARRMVMEHRAAILAVAREVFRDGVWVGSRDDLDLLNFNAPTDSPPVEPHK